MTLLWCRTQHNLSASMTLTCRGWAALIWTNVCVPSTEILQLVVVALALKIAWLITGLIVHSCLFADSFMEIYLQFFSFAHLFVCQFIHSFIFTFACSYVRSLVHWFIHPSISNYVWKGIHKDGLPMIESSMGCWQLCIVHNCINAHVHFQSSPVSG